MSTKQDNILLLIYCTFTIAILVRKVGDDKKIIRRVLLHIYSKLRNNYKSTTNLELRQ